jgi:hypothetical protein
VATGIDFPGVVLAGPVIRSGVWIIDSEGSETSCTMVTSLKIHDLRRTSAPEVGSNGRHGRVQNYLRVTRARTCYV